MGGGASQEGGGGGEEEEGGGGGGGGLSDPHIQVEVRVMLQLAPELLKAFFCVLVLHATLYSTCSIVLH